MKRYDLTALGCKAFMKEREKGQYVKHTNSLVDLDKVDKRFLTTYVFENLSNPVITETVAEMVELILAALKEEAQQ